MGVLTPTVSPPTSAPIPLPTMAMAGVELAEECMDVYTDIMINKKYPYAIFLIADGKIQVEAKGEKDGSSEEQYARFLDDLQKKDGDRDDCRYALYDYEFLSPQEGEPKWIMFLLEWIPDTSDVKTRMMYTSSFRTLMQAFNGVARRKEAMDISEIQQAEIEAWLREK